MKLSIPKVVDYEIFYLDVKAEFRYVGDGEDDDISPSLPGLVGNTWRPLISIGYAQILHWEGKRPWKVFGKVCDAGEYHLRDVNNRVVATLPWGSYVPTAINGGDSDYIDLTIDANGIIQNWNPDFSDFVEYYASEIARKFRSY
jgi:hypothetical protein